MVIYVRTDAPLRRSAAGDSVLERERQVAYVVPSVIVPPADNVVLHPAAAHFTNFVRVVEIGDFRIDLRLFQPQQLPADPGPTGG